MTAARETEVTVAVYDVGDIEAIKKYGNIAVDAEGIITRFEEKPAKATGNTRCDRSVLLLACGYLPFKDVSGCGKQRGSARPFCAVALHAKTGEDVPNPREMARHRKQGDARERGQDSGFVALKR